MRLYADQILDQHLSLIAPLGMARYRKGSAYIPDKEPRYVVVWSMHHESLEFKVLPPMADLMAAMTAAIARLAADGWQAEGGHEFGSVFVRRGDERRLLMLTRRHPLDNTPQSFNPFK
jgi:hypothetical protein